MPASLFGRTLAMTAVLTVGTSAAEGSYESTLGCVCGIVCVIISGRHIDKCDVTATLGATDTAAALPAQTWRCFHTSSRRGR